jgi:YD repeat-containing protein
MDVLVNSSNTTGYNITQGSPGEYQRYLERYLEHWQIPYRVIDTSTQAPPSNLGSVQLIVCGHSGLSLSSSWQQAILQAVQGGSGFVNFDADSAIGTNAHIQGIFGATGSSVGATATVIDVPSAVMPDGATPHYIAAMQIRFADTTAGDLIYSFHKNSSNVQKVATPTILQGAQGTVVAKIGTSPLILATQTTGGRAVDFTTYDFMHPDRFGFMMGIDDLIWRSLVWAARKPFILRGYPRLWASQMDDQVSGWGQRLQALWDPSLTGTVNADGTGGPWKINANAQMVNMVGGGKDRTNAIAGVNAGYLKICLHTNSGIAEGNFYWNAQSSSPLTDAQWQANLAYAQEVIQGQGGADTLPPLSKAMAPHYWNLSNNVGYDMWNTLGTRYITEIQMPGAYYNYGPPKPSSMRIMLKPFRIYELPPTGSNPNELYPIYYADNMTVGSTAGLPSVQFFSFATQLLGSKFPDVDARWPNDPTGISVQESVDNFTEYTWRFWSGMAPVQIYNHDGGSFAASTTAETQQAITQISSFLNANGVVHVFMEDEGAYLRARTQSVLSTAQATPSTISLNFTGNATDMDGNPVPTNFYVYYGDTEGVQQQVPGFNGPYTYTYTITNSEPPAIGVSNPNLIFSSLPGASPISQSVTVSNTGSGTLTYTAQSSATWLTATIGTGTMPDTLTVTVNPAGLASGVYSGTVKIVSPGATNTPKAINVTFTVLGPMLSVITTPLTFTGEVGATNPIAQNATISNSGVNSLNWTASSSASWLQLGAASGTVAAGTPYSLAIVPSIAGLQPGTYAGTVTISSSNSVIGSPQVINVTLTVALMQATFPSSTLDGWAISPQGLASGWSVNNNTAQYNGGGSTQIYAGNSTWSNYTVQAGFLLSTLIDYPGGIRGYINPSTGASYAVWIYPAEREIKIWRTSTWNIDSNGVLLGTSARLTFDDVNWHTLGLSMNGGQIVALYDGSPVVTVTDTTLSSGMMALDVSTQPIQFNNVLVMGNQTVSTNLTSPQSSYNFTVATGSTSVAQALQVATSDGSVAAWSALSSSPWVTVTSSTGRTPGSATVQVNASALTAGAYSGQLNLAAFGTLNSPVVVPITVNVAQPSTNQLSVAPASLSFSVTSGVASAAQALTLSSTSSGLAFTVNSDSTWLTSTTSGTTPASIQVAINQTGLAASTYTGHLTITASAAENPTTVVTVTLVVANPLVAAPVSLNFVSSNAANSPVQDLVVTSPSGTAVGWSGSYQSTWFTASATAGTTPSTIHTVAATSRLSAGTYSDTFSVSPSGSSGVVPLAIPVRVRVGALLFSDNFSSNSNWTASSLGLASNWTVTNNTYSYNGGGATQQYPSNATYNSWTDYTLQMDVTLTNALNYPGGVRFRLNTATGSGYALWLYPANSKVKLLKAPNWSIDSGSIILATANNISLPAGTHHLRIDAQGTAITIYVDYVQILAVTDSNYSAGSIALDVSSRPVAFSNVSVVGFPQTPTLTETTSGTPSLSGQGVTFTATISPSGPTGTVTFYDSGAPISSSIALNGNAATFTASTLAAGTHSITAGYSGDANYTAVTSNAITQIVSQPVSDTGTVSLTITSPGNSPFIATTNYGYGATPSTIAESLAPKASNSLVSVIAVGDTLFMEATTPGAASNSISYTVQNTGWDMNDFSQPSFPASTLSGNFTGGVDAGSSTQGSHTVYRYIGSYADAGDLLSYTDSVMGTWNFSYDTLDRLVSGTPAAGSTINNGLSLCWAYDAFGNRTAQQTLSGACPTLPSVPTATAAYNMKNQVTWVQDSAPTGFTYDGAGNVICDGAVVNGVCEGTHSYIYDGEGRICAVKSEPISGTSTMTGYIYDADGRRVAKGSITNMNSCDPSLNGFQASSETAHRDGRGHHHHRASLAAYQRLGRGRTHRHLR